MEISMNDKIGKFIELMNLYKREKYCVFAGAKRLESVCEDDQIITDEIICPEGGDFIVWDSRCLKGTYGIGSYGKIASVKVKKPTSHGISYRKKPIERIIGTDVLIRRYFWIEDLFSNALHRDTPSPFNAFKNLEEIDLAYENEKTYLSNDPWLAMYWLLHFGFCSDSRLHEIIDLIESESFNKKIDEDLTEYLAQATYFFRNTDQNFSFTIEDNYGGESKDLFLRRRSYLSSLR